MFWVSSRYYSPELCRFISPDDVEYLDPESINGLNLYCYCMNNPIMYADPSGHFSVGIFVLVIVSICVLLFLTSDTPYQSTIKESDININGNNTSGSINVYIDDISIEIQNSYLIKQKADKERILKIIMSSNEYKQYGYDRTIKSYIEEWNAHNFFYNIPFVKNTDWGKRAESVNLNKNLDNDSFTWVYKLF